MPEGRSLFRDFLSFLILSRAYNHQDSCVGIPATSALLPLPKAPQPGKSCDAHSRSTAISNELVGVPLLPFHYSHLKAFFAADLPLHRFVRPSLLLLLFFLSRRLFLCFSPVISQPALPGWGGSEIDSRSTPRSHFRWQIADPKHLMNCC